MANPEIKKKNPTKQDSSFVSPLRKNHLTNCCNELYDLGEPHCGGSPPLSVESRWCAIRVLLE